MLPRSRLGAAAASGRIAVTPRAALHPAAPAAGPTARTCTRVSMQHTRTAQLVSASACHAWSLILATGSKQQGPCMWYPPPPMKAHVEVDNIPGPASHTKRAQTGSALPEQCRRVLPRCGCHLLQQSLPCQRRAHILGPLGLQHTRAAAMKDWSHRIRTYWMPVP